MNFDELYLIVFVYSSHTSLILVQEILPNSMSQRFLQSFLLEM